MCGDNQVGRRREREGEKGSHKIRKESSRGGREDATKGFLAA